MPFAKAGICFRFEWRFFRSIGELICSRSSIRPPQSDRSYARQSVVVGVMRPPSGDGSYGRRQLRLPVCLLLYADVGNALRVSRRSVNRRTCSVIAISAGKRSIELAP
jgi:hypothetical protein